MGEGSKAGTGVKANPEPGLGARKELGVGAFWEFGKATREAPVVAVVAGAGAGAAGVALARFLRG